jgi:hypothetical protein
MNGNEMSQQQRDAAVIQAMRDTLKQLEETPHWSFGQAMQYVSPPDLWWGSVLSCVLVALRTIDRQAAEIERLRAACDGVPEMLKDAADQFDGFGVMIGAPQSKRAVVMRAKAAELSAALNASESDDQP